jgi:hypothetical protein
MDPKDPRARNSYDFVRFIAASIDIRAAFEEGRE